MGAFRTVAVVGAGFSGVLTAIHLLAADPNVRVRLIEKGPQFGRGRAFGAGDKDHLLNVRVANMSAFPDRPDHFAAWLRADSGAVNPEAFVSRARYGRYLQELLRSEMRGAAGRLLLEKDEAVDVAPGPAGFEVQLALGRTLTADAVVLAIGLGAPALPRGVSSEVLSYRNYVGDPWAADLSKLPHGEILLLGSGLTMIDVALSLDHPGRELLAVSPRGLMPRLHAEVPTAQPPAGPTDTVRKALATLRTHARQVGWREAVDSIRARTVEIWSGWSLAERRRFLRHAQPWWDVHRHRASPLAADLLAAAFATTRLAVLAGTVEELTPYAGGFRARIRLRGRNYPVPRLYAAVVNCTGLSGDLRRSRLLSGLAAKGLAQPDPLGLGLDVDGRCRVVGAEGVRGLYAVGPLTRGAFWEAVAVPDLRTQAATVARTVLEELPAAVT